MSEEVAVAGRMPTICLKCGKPIPHEQYPAHVRSCDSTALERKMLIDAADSALAALRRVATSQLVELSGLERDAVALVRQVCHEIIDGER